MNTFLLNDGDIATGDEAEFLRVYRNADEMGKNRILRLVHAAKKGQLNVTKEQAEAMTEAARNAFMDALPEVA